MLTSSRHYILAINLSFLLPPQIPFPLEDVKGWMILTK
jgi:hypothetical protein